MQITWNSPWKLIHQKGRIDSKAETISHFEIKIIRPFEDPGRSARNGKYQAQSMRKIIPGLTELVEKPTSKFSVQFSNNISNNKRKRITSKENNRITTWEG